MQRYREVILTSALDYLLLLASWFVFHSRYSSYLDSRMADFGLDMFAGGVLFSSYWLGIFVLSGLYKRIYLISRLDEFTRVVKAVMLGGLVLVWFGIIGCLLKAETTTVLSLLGYYFGGYHNQPFCH